MTRPRIDDAMFFAGLLALLGASAWLSVVAEDPGVGIEAVPEPEELPERVVSSNLSTDEILLSLLPPERRPP